MIKYYEKYPNYDPSIGRFAREAKDRWGNPAENRLSIVRYGVPFLDNHLYGIDIVSGELLLILGEEKNRKTTFTVNTWVNIMTAELPKDKPRIVIDTLESGLPPEIYSDQIVANLASRYLMQNRHVPPTHSLACPACNGKPCKELTLNPKFLRFMNRTPQQSVAIDRALEEVQSWPLDIWGANLNEGDTRNLYATLKNMDQSSRWVWAAEELGADIFATDHVQQYRFADGVVSDYEKLVRAVLMMGNFVAAYRKVVFMVSQISMTTIREAKSGGKVKSAGGKKPHEEANAIIKASYEQASGQLGIHLEDSRSSSSASSTFIPIDDVSGAYAPNEYQNY